MSVYATSVYQIVKKTMRGMFAAAIAGPPKALESEFSEDTRDMVIAIHCAMIETMASELHNAHPEKSIDDICRDMGFPESLINSRAKRHAAMEARMAKEI